MKYTMINFLCLLILSLWVAGCSRSVPELQGKWYLDVERTKVSYKNTKDKEIRSALLNAQFNPEKNYIEVDGSLWSQKRQYPEEHVKEGRYDVVNREESSAVLDINFDIPLQLRFEFIGDCIALDLKDDLFMNEGVYEYYCKSYIDYQNPQQVAEAFVRSLFSKDAEDFARVEFFVIPKDRDSLSNLSPEDVREAASPPPKRPKVVAKVNGNSGSAIVENWAHDGVVAEFDMVFKGDRWWIEK